MTKKYLVTLYGEKENSEIRYRSTIHPAHQTLLGRIVLEREYKDECEMVQVVNSVLPAGDIKATLDLIQRPEGLEKEMELTDSQAASLGWSRDEV
jgi:hypothetical protein